MLSWRHMAKRIVVPLDGTPLGEAVLPQVAVLARALDALVEVLHVVPPSFVSGQAAAPPPRPPAGLVGAPAVLPDYSPSSTVLHYRYDPGEIDANRRYVDRVAQWLRGEGLDAVATVVEGPDVATEVLRHAANADLLALAAGSRSGALNVGRLVYGSISDRILDEARVPVLLVRVPHAAG